MSDWTLIFKGNPLRQEQRPTRSRKKYFQHSMKSEVQVIPSLVTPAAKTWLERRTDNPQQKLVSLREEKKFPIKEVVKRKLLRLNSGQGKENFFSFFILF
ncbi:hypothetical protein CDAR_246271 [Caerostris darwini]|uniref:Uncharacterized protein n=1 Tax=Caerostris darwini TaxID=1538125 RepID=A0AAV4W9T5_9ARAC|nr:hypothetical protein CDAR_246271 [Caerostris darwini]